MGANTPSARVLVVTVTYNTGETLRPFLATLATASAQPLDVIVVDNASADLSVERALAAEFGATLLELERNLGYGGGVTAGVQQSGSTADYVLIVNPDVSFTPGAIDALVAAADADPRIGSVGPRILDADGSVYPSARNLPSLRTGIGHALLGRLWRSNPWSTRYRAEYAYGVEQRDAGWLSGACVLTRRTAYDAIGGFDERFFMYFEDVDLGARLGKNGWRNVYVPTATVTHTGAHSTAQSAKRMEAAHHESAYVYLADKYSAWYLAPVRLVLRIGLSARKWWVTR
ncbi:glycosyltransferase family 2 protein [Microterricola pindariensis]|uniref:dTDP-Rha--alpha-D-GlcNAc-pyrophosphate polyprenol alpha-3-L-rhamnosyltransferase n=1 Tax=Microterricola pindariensis TaxID=478010 RepID=A0ABX5AZ70_9MICO|nr:glycosyltransferase family 2 protein [Microterricola pindariensis]PPL20202.1 dTDP-Rha--alpha-D-GlcNAc-pyrophosphate polyprenol alpha-3-L-rhamnosyltransferase [Microterricola pindariensis]